MRRAVPYVALVAAAVALDQWIKALVVAGMELGQQIDLLPFLALYRTTNTGIAFSMLSGLGGAGLAVIALAIIGLMVWLASRTRPDQMMARIGFSLIIGGAVGNLIDRTLLGHVIDYVLFHTPVWSFAVFNLADAFISVGAAVVVLAEFLEWRRERAAGD